MMSVVLDVNHSKHMVSLYASFQEVIHSSDNLVQIPLIGEQVEQNGHEFRFGRSFLSLISSRKNEQVFDQNTLDFTCFHYGARTLRMFLNPASSTAMSWWTSAHINCMISRWISFILWASNTTKNAWSIVCCLLLSCQWLPFDVELLWSYSSSYSSCLLNSDLKPDRLNEPLKTLGSLWIVCKHYSARTAGLGCILKMI